MKKLLAIMLVMVLAISLLAACGGRRSSSSGNTGSSSRSSNSSNTPSSDSGSGSGNSGGGSAPASDISDADLEKAADLVKDVIDASDLENKDELKESLDMVLNTNWPADRIPEGIPPYPDGTCATDGEPGSIVMIIHDTNDESCDKYLETLENEGWDITTDSSSGTITPVYNAVKEGVEVSFMMRNANSMVLVVSWEL